jgi:ribokinase
VVAGFVAFDHPMAVNELPAAGSGTLVSARLAHPWPRLGGSGANVARAAAAILGEAGLVSWIGDDQPGTDARATLIKARVRVDGLVIDSSRTAASWLFFDARGDSVSFMDAGTRELTELTAAQRRMLRDAAWLCLTAGPPEVTTAAMDCVGERTRIMWVVKADPDCFPGFLVERLAGRADVVVLNAAETVFIGPMEALTGSVVVTDGALPIRYRCGGKWAEEGIEAAEVVDTTGAGDAFAGALAAYLCETPHGGISSAVAAAGAWTRSFLVRRANGFLGDATR